MKRLLTALLLSSLFFMVVSAQAEVVEDFNINQDPEAATPITEEAVAKIRLNAIANADALLNTPTDIIVGNPNGKITLVQFVDFMCPLSGKMDPALQALIKANPDLRVVYKPYPLRGNVSSDAVKTALIAYKKGKYIDVHVALMKIGKDLTEEDINTIAKSQGLDIKELRQEMTNKQYADQIVNTRKLAQKIGLIGTPSLFFAKSDLNKDSNQSEVIFMLGSFNQHELQDVIDYIKSVNKI